MFGVADFRGIFFCVGPLSYFHLFDHTVTTTFSGNMWTVHERVQGFEPQPVKISYDLVRSATVVKCLRRSFFNGCWSLYLDNHTWLLRSYSIYSEMFYSTFPKFYWSLYLDWACCRQRGLTTKKACRFDETHCLQCIESVWSRIL